MLFIIEALVFSAAAMMPLSQAAQPAVIPFRANRTGYTQGFTSTVTSPQVPTDNQAGAATEPAVEQVETGIGPVGHIVYPAYNASSRTWDLYVINVNGGDPGWLHEQADQPAFSADGSSVAFRRLHPSFLGLASTNMNTGELTQLTRFAEDAWPNWSYDVGSMLLFSSQRRSDRRWRIFGLITYSEITEWELAVNNKPIYANYPLWLPGNNMVYVGCVEGECGLILADGDGSRPRPLTSHPGDLVPDVSPNGTWIAFLVQNEANWDIHVVNVTNGETVPVLHSPADEGSPEWSPDGRYLGFVSNRDSQTAVWAIAFDTDRETVSNESAEPVRLFELTELPPEGWPWLDERIAWGP